MPNPISKPDMEVSDSRSRKGAVREPHPAFPAPIGGQGVQGALAFVWRCLKAMLRTLHKASETDAKLKVCKSKKHALAKSGEKVVQNKNKNEN